MAFHGVQGRGVLVDVAHHLGHEFRGVDRAMLEEIMAADNVVVEPGDMLLIHTGFATKVLEWNREPDPGARSTGRARTSTRDDESLLEWIADSQISALVADNYAVEGMVGGGPLVDPPLPPLRRRAQRSQPRGIRRYRPDGQAPVDEKCAIGDVLGEQPAGAEPAGMAQVR